MKNKFPKAFFIIPLIHLAVALPLAYHLNIWADEASTLYTTQEGVIEAAKNAGYEKQAPLYFVLLSIWRLVDNSVFFARLFSIVCSVLSIGVFFQVIRRLWNENVALFATFFFAIHPYLFWASTEARVYSLVILLSLVLIVLFDRAFLDDGQNHSWTKYAFTLVAAIALSTQYFIGFLLVGFFGSLLVTRRFRSAADYLLRMIIVMFLASPVVWLSLGQISSDIDRTGLESSVVEGVRMIWHHMLTFAVPTELFPPEEQTAISFLRLWLIRILAVVAIGVLLVRRRFVFDRVTLVFAAQTATICFFLLLVYFIIGRLYVEIRHAAVLFAPFAILVTAIAVNLAPRDKFRVLYFGTLMIVLMVFYSYGLTAVHPNFTKRGDWTRVARYIEANENPDQPVVVFSNYEALALIQSYRGKNRVLPEERFFDWKYEGEFGTEKMWPKQIAYVISVIPESADEIWLVTEENCQTGPACRNLENWVKENYTVAKQKDFYKERVRLLRKK